MRSTYIQKIVLVILILGSYGLPIPVHGDIVTDRFARLSNTLPSATSAYTIQFTTATTASIGSIRFQFCTDRFGSCVAPVGLNTLGPGVTLQSQFGMGNFVITQPSQGEILLVRSVQPALAGQVSYYTFDGITNPSFSNVSFYIRVSTYGTADGSGPPVDDGGVVVAITSALTVEGVTPETLSFCIGVTGNSCSDLHGQLIGFGDFSPTQTSSASTVMFAATNADNGYVINLYGQTLSSGSNSIPAMGAQALNSAAADTSSVGTSQFGTNIVANSNPNVGTGVSGGGVAAPAAGYGSSNHFRFFNGDTVASTAGPSDINRFTNSYMVNISRNQAIGFYTATLTYICTGNF